MWVYNSRILCSGFPSPYIGGHPSFGECSTVDLEFNALTRTLHFFVDGTQLSHYITNINTYPLAFGISAYNTSSKVEIAFYIHLRFPSVDNTNCTKYKWGTGENDRKLY
jgi:hypothetical protein